MNDWDIYEWLIKCINVAILLWFGYYLISVTKEYYDASSEETKRRW